MFFTKGKTQAAMQKLQQSIALEESKIAPIFNASAVYKATNQPSLEFEMLNFISKVRSSFFLYFYLYIFITFCLQCFELIVTIGDEVITKRRQKHIVQDTS